MLNDVNELINSSVTHFKAISQNEKIKTEIVKAVHACITSIKKGHKIIICGNGGSAADAQHIAAEFTGRFELERRPLPAIALTTDTSALTAIGNDYGFDEIFSRQIVALGNAGDTLIAISTSGNSANIIKCAESAKKLGINVVVMTGYNEGNIDKLADISLKCMSERTANIQEGHIMMAHIICNLVEKEIASP